MSDITANLVVGMPAQLFTLARSFKANANGKIFIGTPDTDPTIPANQIQVYVENEDGSLVPVAQPIVINAGGFPVLSGQIRKFVTVQNYSMLIQDVYGAQQFYFEDVAKYDPDQLRQQLESAADGNGDAIVRVKQPVSGSIVRTQHEKNAENITVADAGAAGDGVTDDTEAFALFETWLAGQVVDLRGLSFAVSSVPIGNRYTNGYFIVSGVTYAALYRPARDSGNIISLGDAAESLPATATTNHAVIALGKDALKSATSAQDTIAIGFESMMNSPFGAYGCVGLGYRTLKNLTPSSTSSDATGTRNTAVGGLSQMFNTTGVQNATFGRNSGSSITTGSRNTHLGTNAGLGWCPVGFDGEIKNYSPMTATATLVGHGSGEKNQGGGNSFFGAFSGYNIKFGINNTLIGEYCLVGAESGLAMNGKTYSRSTSVAGTYTQSGYVVTVTAAAHGGVVGGWASLSLDGSDQNRVIIESVPDANTFTCTINVSATRSGAAIVAWTATLNDGIFCNQNNVMGRYALQSMLSGSGNVAIGDNVGTNLLSATNAVLIGRRAGSVVLGGDANTSYGDNVIAIGNVAPLSGNNQIQLGNSVQTVYYYQMQQRSDGRDKADKREIDADLAVAFVRGLVPQLYKYDYRDDYYEEYKVQVGIDDEAQPVFETRLRPIEKDGSKMRERDHAGFIAQQVKELMDRLGIDFGMYQDHLKNGGADVKTLDYQQVIPFVTKALDVAFIRIEEIEDRLKKLESK